MNENKKSPDGRSGLESEKIYTYENYNSKDQDHPLLFDDVDEREKSILDFIVTDPASSELAVESLEVEDFRTDTHKKIFRAVKSLYDRGEPADVLNICSKLGDTHRPDGGDWGSYLTNVLSTALPIVESNLEFHLEKIKQTSHLRKISALSYLVHEAANRGESETVWGLIESLNEAQADSGSFNKLKPVPAKDLPDIPPPEPLWGEFLYPEFVSQLIAEPGAGKSTLAYNIAGLGAQGKEFLGIPFSKGTIKTLYFDFESPRWLQKQKLLSICNELSENFHILEEFNFKQDINRLESLVKKEKYDLIVFDTQSLALDMEDENNNSEANRLIRSLKKLAKKTGAAILLIHHTKKAEGGKDVYRGRGASATPGAIDIVANLKSQSSDTLRLEICKSRYSRIYPFPVYLMKKVGNDKFERVYTDEDHQGLKSSQTQNFILSLLGDEREWQTAEIQEHAEKEGYKARTVESELRRLVDQGKVIKPRQGIYKLVINPEGKSLNGRNEDSCGEPFELS